MVGFCETVFAIISVTNPSIARGWDHVNRLIIYYLDQFQIRKIIIIRINILFYITDNEDLWYDGDAHLIAISAY